MTAQHETRGFYGWKNLIILFFCYLVMYGIVFYGFSVIFPAMIKAMKWARGDASIAQTIRALMVGLATPVVAIIINRWGTKRTLLLGGTVTIVALVLLGTVVTQIWSWILLWGFIAGFGLSAAGLVTVQTNATYWFSKNRGLALGIVGTGAAVGGFLAQPLFAWIIKLTGQWQMGWLCAAVISVVGLIPVFWLRNKPQDYGQYPDGISPEERAAAAGARKAARTYRTSESWNLKEAMRTRTMWLLMIMYCVLAMSVYLITAHGVLSMTDKGLTLTQAAYVLGFVILFGGIARFPMGWLADFIEPRWIVSVMMTGILVSLILFWQSSNVTTLVAAACVFGFSYGATLVLLPTMIGNYYTPAAFATVNGFMFPFQVGFGAVVPVTAGYIHDISKSYDLAFTGILVLCVVAVLSALLAAPPIRQAAGEVRTAQI